MELYYKMLLNTPLFGELTINELHHMLECLNASVKSYGEGQFIIGETDINEDIGLVLSGEVQILTIDILGNRSITAVLGVGEVFGQVSAGNQNLISPVSVVAVNECDILHLKFHKLVSPCTRACSFHSRVIENMMNILGQRNLMMNRKLAILSQRSIREKLLTFLSFQYQDEKSRKFTIAFNRDELADYLCVNRSALSREISAMVEDGLITTYRNNFILHEPY
ncbi:MAG: Crp/Fnr family transcriptional regulator [Sphaerochaetaceae bacterium]